MEQESTVTVSRKKPVFPVRPPLHRYLRRFGREVRLPVAYADLRAYSEAVPVVDKTGKDTLWETALYAPADRSILDAGLKQIYTTLKAGGEGSVHEHLFIDRIDCCTFGNTQPFRIRIVNRYNDVYDYFYLKAADASRVYGLELEHLLSPNRMNFLVEGGTLVEEHIPGIPGDTFARVHLPRAEYNPKRIAKEFVKFNERCLIRLLGDMRAYNFVVDITPDFDDFQFRIRPIDFDQQAYEGDLRLYRPQFYKENFPYVEGALKHFNAQVMAQYRSEEHALIVQRIRAERVRLAVLREALRADDISTPEKRAQLRESLAEFYDDPGFGDCESTADLLERSLKRLLE